MAYGLVFDNFLTAVNMVGQLAAGAMRNLAESVSGTLRKGAASNPYGASIARSIDAYYQSMGKEPDPRLDGAFGARVIAECERIVRAIQLPPQAAVQAAPAMAPAARPRILVLGGSGFIGRHLVRALAGRGLGVRVATRSARSARLALAGVAADVVEGDLADPAFVDAALEGIEVVYDLARAVGVRWEDYYTQDVLVTKQVAERALARGVKRFIYTGTIDSYYSARAGDVITGETPLDADRRRNHYARSKAACEALLMDLHRERGLPLVVFRPGIVIGKGTAPAHWGVGMFVSESRVKLWGDGRHPLPFVLVEDVADALVLALDRPGIEGRTFLLTDEPLLSGRDYVEAVSKASGTRLRAIATPIWKFYAADLLKEAAKHLIRHPNRRVPSYRDWRSRTHRARYDSSATREALGWRPAGSRDALLERGIVQAVREFTR
jgi:nucleoside-diphosphate-sugar epimerase